MADRLDEYMLVNNVSSDSELGIYLVNKGITPFPDRFKPYINYARVGAEYREKHGGEYSSGNYVQKKTPELFGERDWTAFSGYGWKTPALFVYRAKQRRSLCLRPLSNWRAPDNFWEWTASIWRNSLRVEALRPYLGEYLPLQGMDLRLEQLDELAEKYPDNGSGGWRIAEIPLCPWRWNSRQRSRRL